MKLTISLLQGYDWYMECPPSWKEKAYEQLVDMLNKRFFSSTAIERGNRYEDIINHKLMAGEAVPKELEGCRGLQQQVWLKPFTIEGVTFRGKMDYYEPGVQIRDLKTTKKFNKQSYDNKWQHIVYMLAQGETQFVYDIAVFPDDTGLEPSQIISLGYSLQPQDKERLATRIREFLAFLKREDLWEVYINVYNG